MREGVYEIGDGSEWFLVDEEMLMRLTEELERGDGGSAEDDGGAGLPVYDNLGGAEAGVMAGSSCGSPPG